MLKVEQLEMFINDSLEECKPPALYHARATAHGIIMVAKRYNKVELYKRAAPLYRAILREIEARDAAPKGA